MEYSFSFEINLAKVLLCTLWAVVIYFLIAWCFSDSRSGGLDLNLAEDTDTPTFMLVGNDNYSISGLTFEGKRIPDVEIKSKALYVDGTFKRKLARNSRVYNRGVGIFADGKYVG